jgi:hypothetical protein
MAEDSPAAPLPRRVPGSNRRRPDGREPATGPVRPAALPDDVLQRICDALVSMRESAPPEHTAQAERPASLPRRVPGASKGPGPPAVMARPRLPSPPPALPRSPTDEAAADQFPGVGVSPARGHAKITARPDANTEDPSARPGPGKEASAGSRLGPVPRPREAERPDGHEQTDGETGRPERALGHQENGQDRRAKRPARRAKVPGRAAKPRPPERPSRPPQPASRKAPTRPGEPVPQMALLFPEEPAPEQATMPPPTPLRPQPARRGRLIGWLILVMALVSAGSLALLLAR